MFRLLSEGKGEEVVALAEEMFSCLAENDPSLPTPIPGSLGKMEAFRFFCDLWRVGFSYGGNEPWEETLPKPSKPEMAKHRSRILELMLDVFKRQADYTASAIEEAGVVKRSNISELTRNASILLACGRRDFVCPILKEIDKKISDFPMFLPDDPGWGEDLLLFAFVKELCREGQDVSREKRAARLAELARPYADEPWLLDALRSFARLELWGTSLYGVDGRYAFLDAVEPFCREKPGKAADKFYEKLALAANALHKRDDTIRWCKIVLARPETHLFPPHAYQNMTQRAENRLREQRNEPHPHEEDITMIKELGL